MDISGVQSQDFQHLDNHFKVGSPADHTPHDIDADVSCIDIAQLLMSDSSSKCKKADSKLKSCEKSCYLFFALGAAVTRTGGVGVNRCRSYSHSAALVIDNNWLLLVIDCLRMRNYESKLENWSGQNRTGQTACYGHELSTQYERECGVMKLART